MKAIKQIIVALSLIAASAGLSQTVVLYDNQISLVDDGRVNDPDFPVFVLHADDFSLSSNAVINQVSWLGAYKDGNFLPDGDDDFTIRFFDFQAGIPATIPFASFAVGAADRQLTSQSLPFGNPVFSYSARFPETQLSAGTYLIAIVNNPVDDDLWLWAAAERSPGNSYTMLFEGTPWRKTSGTKEFAFAISHFRDATPPQIGSVVATPAVLWPPDHRMIPVSVSVNALDNYDPSPAVRITQVTSSESQNPLMPDWEITGPLSVNLRAERLASGEGRTYTIVVESEDASGNISSASVDVIVPHDRK